MIAKLSDKSFPACVNQIQNDPFAANTTFSVTCFTRGDAARVTPSGGDEVSHGTALGDIRGDPGPCGWDRVKEICARCFVPACRFSKFSFGSDPLCPTSQKGARCNNAHPKQVDSGSADSFVEIFKCFALLKLSDAETNWANSKLQKREKNGFVCQNKQSNSGRTPGDVNVSLYIAVLPLRPS